MEKTEQIKIALLGVIALMMIIKTVNMPTGGSAETARIPVNQPITTPSVSFNNSGGSSVQGVDPIIQTVPQLTAPQPLTTVSAPTTMVFDEIAGNLGAVSIADGKSFTYKVTNTGTNPLTFNQINADAGLTIVNKPSAPIAPGEKGEITVSLTAEAGKGPINKTIHVGTNTEPSHMHLTLEADIK